MCIGTPVQLLTSGGYSATALGTDGVRDLSLLLTGPLPAGAWVLAQGDLAIREITEDDADLIEQALAACLAAERGERWEDGFADLINREPELPAHLRATAAQQDRNQTRMEDADGGSRP